MIERPGYDEACAEAAAQAMASYDQTFSERAKNTEFWGLFDPEPCGAVIFEGNVIHVACLKPCGLAVRRIVRQALQNREILFAPIAEWNTPAIRLAVGLGFKLGIQSRGVNLYWRTP